MLGQTEKIRLPSDASPTRFGIKKRNENHDRSEGIRFMQRWSSSGYTDGESARNCGRFEERLRECWDYGRLWTCSIRRIDMEHLMEGQPSSTTVEMSIPSPRLELLHV